MERKKTGPKPRAASGKASSLFARIRTTEEERSEWYDKAEKMGYKSFSDCVRSLMAQA